jgi:UTP--glucose-1-phosphate uridylyltransferase
VPAEASCIYVRQGEALGLGHAVACAGPLIDADEPFAVLLADDLMDGEPPILKQMIAAHERTGRSILAVSEISSSEVSSYGIVAADLPPEGQSRRVTDMVEKPKLEDAPSNLAVVGRYILDGSIMQILKNQEPGSGGEIQLTDAIRNLIFTTGVEAYRYVGRRYDCGSKIGYIEATLAYSLAHSEFGPEVRRMIAAI